MCQADADCDSGVCVGGVCDAVLLISQIQTRGTAGGNDEFIEIYNPGGAPVVFDSTWTVWARSAVGICTGNSEAQRFAGGGQTIPAHRHILFTNSAGYDGAVAGDGTYMTGFTDAGSVVLKHNNAVADAVCFQYDAATLASLTTCATPYTCEGVPALNPHNNTGSTNNDASLERLPGGAGGNAKDTGDTLTDFVTNNTASPRNLLSAPTP